MVDIKKKICLQYTLKDWTFSFSLEKIRRIDKKIQINKVDTGKLFSLNNPALIILTKEHVYISQDSQ